jgi:prevent-host-death family protein
VTKSVNVHEAKTHLSRLLDEVAAGEEIVIAKAGRPVARLVPEGRRERPRGWMAGVWPDLPPDSAFFDPLPDGELDAWES